MINDKNINAIINDSLKALDKFERLKTHRGTTTFISLHENYQSAISWMLSIGVEINKSSRIYTYSEIFRHCANRIATGTSPKKLFAEKYTAAAIHDSYIFINCFNSLKDRIIIDSQIIIKFLITSKGPICYTDEKTGESSRNYLFELIASAFFYNSRSNFRYKSTPIGDINPQIAITHENTTKVVELKVECKKIHSKNKFKTRLKEAFEQAELRISIETENLSYGVVCIDITKIINPSNTINFCGNDSEYYDASEEYPRKMQALISENISVFDEMYDKHTNVLGIFIHTFNMMEKQGFEIPTGVQSKVLITQNYAEKSPYRDLTINEIIKASRQFHLSI